MYQRTTFNVVFFCKKTKISKKGKAPIYARITTSGQTTEIYTQCQIEPERWNQRLERSLYKDEVAPQRFVGWNEAEGVFCAHIAYRCGYAYA